MASDLYRFRFPSADVCAVPDLYLRGEGDADYSTVSGELRIGPAASVRFDTYFNAMGVGRLVRHTTVRHLELTALVAGACRLEVIHARIGQEARVVAATGVDTSEPTWVDLTLPPLETLADGAVFLNLETATGSATLYDASWRTPDQAPRSAQLGVVIPTFNRPGYVRANIRRFLDALADAPSYKDRIEVLVVDNARNLDLDIRVGDPITVLPNPNSGGAGGFARGLMHFRRRPGVTHVLFMDDDVTFDPEIIFRATQLLSFARDPELCIAGAMLREDVPAEQFEAGAWFLGKAIYPTRPAGQGVDLADWNSLLQTDQQDERVDYGAWWFFAFPLALSPENPIPAFVRGDDVCWGLMHHAGAHTTTFPGVGLWHGDFVYKNGPVTWFYDTRNFALIGVLTVPGFRWWHLVWRYLNTCGRSLLSFKYTSASHITAGMQEFLRGPDHWLSLDQAKLHEWVVSYDEERPRALATDLVEVDDVAVPRGAAKISAALLSAALLGGHVLPDSLLRRPIGAVPMQDRALEVSTLRSELLYRDASRREGFVARRDRRRFFTLLTQMVATSVRIPFRFGTLKRAYRAMYPRMVSNDYWEQQFSSPPHP